MSNVPAPEPLDSMHIVRQVREFFANAGGAMSQQPPSHQEKMESGWELVPETAVNTDNPLAIAAEAERIFATREETQRENAELREAIKRLQENTAARNPWRAQ